MTLPPKKCVRMFVTVLYTFKVHALLCVLMILKSKKKKKTQKPSYTEETHRLNNFCYLGFCYTTT